MLDSEFKCFDSEFKCFDSEILNSNVSILKCVMHVKCLDSAALVWGISNVSILKVVDVDVVSDLKCFDFAALVWGISNVSILKCIVHFKCVDSAALVWGIVVLKHGWATVRNFKNIYRLFDRRSPNVSEAHPDQPRRTSRLQAKTGHSPAALCSSMCTKHRPPPFR